MKKQFSFSTLFALCGAILLALLTANPAFAQAEKPDTIPQITAKSEALFGQLADAGKVSLTRDASGQTTFNQTIIVGEAPVFVAKASCLFCKRGPAESFRISLRATKTFELPGVVGYWQLYRPGSAKRYDPTDPKSRVTYGGIRNSAYPAHLSYVGAYSVFDDVIVIPFGEDSDSPAGEYILRLAITLWDGTPVQLLTVPFYLDETPESGRGRQAVDAAIAGSDGYFTIYGRFIQGNPYGIWVGDLHGGGYNKKFSSDGRTLPSPVGSSQQYESNWDVIVIDLITQLQLTLPGGVQMQKYVYQPPLTTTGAPVPRR